MTSNMKQIYGKTNYREYVEKAMFVKKLDNAFPAKEDKLKKLKI